MDPLDALIEPTPEERKLRRAKEALAEARAAGPRDIQKRLEREVASIVFQPPALPKGVSRAFLDGYKRNAMRDMVQLLTANGLELVLQALSVLRGEATQHLIDKHGEPIEVGPSLKDIAEARKWLAEYLPQPAKKLEISGPDGGPIEVGAPRRDLKKLNSEQLRALLELERLAAAPEVDGEIVEAPSDPKADALDAEPAKE